MTVADRQELDVLLAASRLVTTWEVDGPSPEVWDRFQELVDAVHAWLDKPKETNEGFLLGR